MNYKIDKPYPIPRVESPNKTYAKLLLEDYAGNVSEDTAIHLYLYQFFMTNNELQQFANAMEQIAEVEMHHLSLLGQTIKLLGLLPAYGTVLDNNKFKNWNSGNVNYTTDLKKMIEVDIQSETDAIKNYRYHYSIINDRYVRKLIARIIEDEELHLAIFNYFYQKFFPIK